MKSIKPENYTKSKKLICDWSDKKRYLIHNRMLKFYVRHGMIVEKIHEIISFKQSTKNNRNEIKILSNLLINYTENRWKIM